MNRLIIFFCLVFVFLFTNTGIAFAANSGISESMLKNPEILQQWEQYKTFYENALDKGKGEGLPSSEYMKEMERLVYESARTGEDLKPSPKILREMEKQYEETMKKVHKEMLNAELQDVNNLSVKSISIVNKGSTYTFNQADCGSSGEHGDTVGGKFKHDWGCDSGGWADALTSYNPTINPALFTHTATTWATVGKKIKVNGTGNARIYFNGEYGYSLIGNGTAPMALSVGTIVAVIYDLTDGVEKKRKVIHKQQNPLPIPSMYEDSFNEYIDLELEDDHVYTLKLGVEAYCSGAGSCYADLINYGDNPGAGDDGVDYNYIKITWR
ncbi:hypothetical protein [Thermosyntropha sp.]|uniref:hypothetical protein n=1 Tax=Thermosyntropha sp. TaxID=2740820 RepID=UPI0025CFB92B|nr:hypothetical protein [Thermosyntropha sp.]MBO8158940.1 hypothetical protein [Thermosyntropha sp.]